MCSSDLYGTDVVVFLDGREQRCRKLAAPIRHWVVELTMLDESEVRSLEEFLISNRGSYGNFSFIDPWSGITYPSCSFDEDIFSVLSEAHDRIKVRVTVRENRQ